MGTFVCCHVTAARASLRSPPLRVQRAGAMSGLLGCVQLVSREEAAAAAAKGRKRDKKDKKKARKEERKARKADEGGAPGAKRAKRGSDSDASSSSDASDDDGAAAAGAFAPLTRRARMLLQRRGARAAPGHLVCTWAHSAASERP